MDNIFIGSSIVGLILILLSFITQLQGEISRIKLTLDKIAKQVGVPSLITEDVETELKNLILDGKKIKAIKQYRIITGIGLKEAKDYIDELSVKTKF
ncbi:ribosomal protein L7/L12 [Clostridium sp.]|uniref:ribosomal protein L7/L12 n=1 Tax=Clostridium sp. TaxID=1506 RepID=UPI003D6D14FE